MWTIVARARDEEIWLDGGWACNERGYFPLIVRARASCTDVAKGDGESSARGCEHGAVSTFAIAPEFHLLPPPLDRCVSCK